MTNTPRTDANCWDITEGRFRDEYTSVVKSEFARELEEENVKMKRTIKRISLVVNSGYPYETTVLKIKELLEEYEQI